MTVNATKNSQDGVSGEASASAALAPQPDNLPRTYSLKELLATVFPPIIWVVSDLVRSGAVTMVSALWGQRKSWVCQHLALCVASGSKVFGHFDVVQTGVMIVNEEDCLPDLKERMRLLAPTSDDLPIYFRAEQDFKLNKKDAVAELIVELKEKEIGLVIFDSLRSVHTATENDSDEMQRVMDTMKPIVRAGIAVIFTHHSRKPSQGQQSGDPSGADTRGSGAINAAVFGHLEIRNTREDGIELVIVTQRKNKGGEMIKSFKVRVEKFEGGGLGFVYAGEQEADNGTTKTAEKIIVALQVAGRWMSVKELEQNRVGKDRAIRTALETLKSAKRIEVAKRYELGGQVGAGASNAEFFRVVGARDVSSDPF